MEHLVDTLREYIDSDALTQEQRDVCYRDAGFVVRACPGSGKTRTTATRLAWRIANWQSRHSGVAVLSFTNVAWREIGSELVRLGLPGTPRWPHFLGTIDSFVNRHIFLPFGHLVMGCKGRPEIVHEGNEAWIDQHIGDSRYADCRQKGCGPLKFVLDINGKATFRSRGPKKQPANCGRGRCDEVKRLMVKRGFALYSDAMYWSLCILAREDIRQAIASRFPEIIIDEAQDTSEMQLKIIEALIDAGSKVVLVGDPDQAIYEFHDARPDLFVSFASRWPTLPLSANFRSSQHICNATWLFSGLQSPATAAGMHRGCAVKPILKVFTPGAEAELLPWFQHLLSQHAISPSAAAVLARKHDLIAILEGTRPHEWPARGVYPLTKAFARASVYRDAGNMSNAHDRLMWACLRLCFDRSSYGSGREAIQSIGERQWRRQTWRLLQDMPSTAGQLSDWGPQVADVIAEFLVDNGWPCAVDLRRTFCRCKDPSAQAPVSDFVRVAAKAFGVTCKVIHQAKGETYDAAMVVCCPRRPRTPGDFEQWLYPDVGGAEERRIGYVGMTRPRKLLVLAVPEGSQLDNDRTAALISRFDVQK